MNQSPRTSSNSPPSNNGSKYPHSYMNNNSPSPTSSYNPNMANRNFNQYHNQRPPYWNNNSMYQQQFYPQQMNYPLMGYSPQNNYQQFNPNFGIQPQGMMYQSNNNFHPNFNNGNMNPNFGKNKHNFKNNKINKHGPPQNNNYKNNSNSNKKQKVEDSKETAEAQNCKIFCELCDREFKSDDKYKEHCATHTKCHVEGCKYVAAEKLVKIHFHNFHASGMDKKIPKLDTPEEIEKYRNERKKNFPSNANIENKTKLEAEISKSGAVLETKQFGRLKNNKKRQFDSENKNPFEKPEDGDSNYEQDDSKKLTKSLSPITNNSNLGNKIKNKKNRNKNKKFKLDQSKLTRKPTLLQQLLADEIRHERNILLQCVRYVIKNNFFDKKTDSSTSNNVLNVSNNDVEHPTSQLVESLTETDESEVTMSDETIESSFKTDPQIDSESSGKSGEDVSSEDSEESNQ